MVYTLRWYPVFNQWSPCSVSLHSDQAVSCRRPCSGPVDAQRLSRLRRFLRWLAGSAVFRLFARDGAATRAWPGSITSAVMGGAANLPTALVRWIYRPCRKVLEGSFFWRLIALLGQSTALLTGLFLLVLLSVPHDYWNNAYGFLGALVLAGGVSCREFLGVVFAAAGVGGGGPPQVAPGRRGCPRVGQSGGKDIV